MNDSERIAQQAHHVSLLHSALSALLDGLNAPAGAADLSLLRANARVALATSESEAARRWADLEREVADLRVRLNRAEAGEARP